MSANKKTIAVGGGGDYGTPAFAKTYFRESYPAVTTKKSATNHCTHVFVAGQDTKAKQSRHDVNGIFFNQCRHDVVDIVMGMCVS
jgi:hypothetical protein